jgi:hypothetical protein
MQRERGGDWWCAKRVNSPAAAANGPGQRRRAVQPITAVLDGNRAHSRTAECEHSTTQPCASQITGLYDRSRRTGCVEQLSMHVRAAPHARFCCAGLLVLLKFFPVRLLREFSR